VTCQCLQTGGGECGQRIDVLFVELADRPVRFFSFFLKNLDLSLEALGLGAGLSARTSFVLVGLDLRFELLNLALKHLVLVRQRRNLLLLLCRLRFELLDLCLELLGPGTALVRLDAESLHALCGINCQLRIRHGMQQLWR